MSFNGKIELTARGRAALAAAQQGGMLRMRSVAMGDGQAEEGQVHESLVREQARLHILEQTLENGRLTIRADYANETNPQGWFFYELGIYADTGPNTEGFLYAYGASATGEYIPPQQANAEINKMLLITLAVDSAENVTAVLDRSTMYVSQGGKATAEQAQAGINDENWMTPQKTRAAIDAQVILPNVPDKAGTAEAEAGINNEKYVTPLGVSQAIDAQVQWPQKANAQDAKTGTDDSKYMTALRTRDMLLYHPPYDRVIVSGIARDGSAWTPPGYADLIWAGTQSDAAVQQALTAAAGKRVKMIGQFSPNVRWALGANTYCDVSEASWTSGNATNRVIDTSAAGSKLDGLDTGWISLTLSSGLTASEPCLIRRVGAWVYSAGIAAGVVAGSTSTIATIPVGYRPTNIHRWVLFSSNGGVFSSLYIIGVILGAITNTATSVSLSTSYVVD